MISELFSFQTDTNMPVKMNLIIQNSISTKAINTLLAVAWIRFLIGTNVVRNNTFNSYKLHSDNINLTSG